MLSTDWHDGGDSELGAYGVLVEHEVLIMTNHHIAILRDVMNNSYSNLEEEHILLTYPITYSPQEKL